MTLRPVAFHTLWGVAWLATCSAFLWLIVAVRTTGAESARAFAWAKVSTTVFIGAFVTIMVETSAVRGSLLVLAGVLLAVLGIGAFRVRRADPMDPDISRMFARSAVAGALPLLILGALRTVGVVP